MSPILEETSQACGLKQRKLMSLSHVLPEWLTYSGQGAETGGSGTLYHGPRFCRGTEASRGLDTPAGSQFLSVLGVERPCICHKYTR